MSLILALKYLGYEIHVDEESGACHVWQGSHRVAGPYTNIGTCRRWICAQRIRPCPFCGSTVTLVEQHDGSHLFACDQRSTCQGSGLVAYARPGRSLDSAVEAWNRRARVEERPQP